MPLRLVRVEPEKQPTLTAALGRVNPATGERWRSQTTKFWRQLAEFPTTRGLLGPQWTLLAAAMIHFDALLAGHVKAAAEFRLELAKFGIAPDDVARLRFQFAQADEMEARARPAAPASRRVQAVEAQVEGQDDRALEAVVPGRVPDARTPGARLDGGLPRRA